MQRISLRACRAVRKRPVVRSLFSSKRGPWRVTPRPLHVSKPITPRDAAPTGRRRPTDGIRPPCSPRGGVPTAVHGQKVPTTGETARRCAALALFTATASPRPLASGRTTVCSWKTTGLPGVCSNRVKARSRRPSAIALTTRTTSEARAVASAFPEPGHVPRLRLEGRAPGGNGRLEDGVEVRKLRGPLLRRTVHPADHSRARRGGTAASGRHEREDGEPLDLHGGEARGRHPSHTAVRLRHRSAARPHWNGRPRRRMVDHGEVRALVESPIAVLTQDQR